MPDRKPCSWNGLYYLNYYVFLFLFGWTFFLYVSMQEGIVEVPSISKLVTPYPLIAIYFPT
jgi:hypothetical protein